MIDDNESFDKKKKEKKKKTLITIPSVDIIFEYLIKNKSHLNEKVINCIVPYMLLNKQILSESMNLLFNDVDDDSRTTLKYMKKLHFDDKEKNCAVPQYFPDKNFIDF